MQLGPEKTQILEYLTEHPAGKSITCVSEDLGLNRNLVGKYLAILTEAGKVQQRSEGPAKIYSLAATVPANKIINSLFDWVAVLDKEGTIKQANNSFLQGAGIEETGNSITETKLPEKLTTQALRYATSITSCPKDAEGIYRTNSATHHVKFVPSMLENQQAGLAVIINDVTEKTHKSHQCSLFSTILETQQEAVIVTDNNLEAGGPHIMYVNDAATSLTGYTKQDLLGKSPRILQGPATDKAVLHRLKRALQNKRSFEGETINYRKNGDRYTVEWQIRPFAETGNTITHWISTQRDTSAQQANDEILLRYEELQEALRGISKVIDDKEQARRTIATRLNALLDAPVILAKRTQEGGLEPIEYADSRNEYDYKKTDFTLTKDDATVQKLLNAKQGINAKTAGARLHICPVLRQGELIGAVQIINKEELHPQEKESLKIITNFLGCVL